MLAQVPERLVMDPGSDKGVAVRLKAERQEGHDLAVLGTRYLLELVHQLLHRTGTSRLACLHPIGCPGCTRTVSRYRAFFNTLPSFLRLSPWI